MAVTPRPRDLQRIPTEEVTMPLPTEEMTPPETRMYFMFTFLVFVEGGLKFRM